MRNRRRRKLFIIRAVFLLIIAVCLFKISHTYYLSAKHKREQAKLEGALKQAQALSDESDKDLEELPPEASVTDEMEAGVTDEAETEEESTVPEPEIMEQFESLYDENNDLAGWLSVPDMKIDYPVMQCDDNEYYLHHNFYGEDDNYGCLYVKDFADVNTPGTNVVIYGHNMKDGSMFGDLDKYRSEKFYKEHKFANFNTLYEERTYEVMAVFLSQVFDSDDDVFKYYDFYQADTEEEFNYFYENVKEMALYDTGVTAEFGDTFITLSTCAYHVQDGRLVVVAKRVKNDKNRFT